MSMKEMAILAQDEAALDFLPKYCSFKIYRRPSVELAESAKNIFVFSSLSKLSSVSEFVTAANGFHHLKGLFLKKDLEDSWFPQVLDHAKVRALSKMLIYSDGMIPRRIIYAWSLDAQEDLIARASVVGDQLWVVNCAFKQIRIPFDSLIALGTLQPAERGDFTIAEDGSYIHWAKPDFHLDMDDFRCVVDEEFKKKMAEKVRHDSRFGISVGKVRKESGLRQSDISGVSERQIRGIKKGDMPTVSTLRVLSSAHNLSLEAYLERIGRSMNEVEEYS